MNAHIVNCSEEDFLGSFLPGGYLGVGIIVRGTRPGQLSNACRMSYSMYADMKTIRPRDIIFVHAGQRIYGAFMAQTEFLEDPNAPRMFLSRNIHYYPNPREPRSGWQNTRRIPRADYHRRIAITHFCDSEGRSLCFENGFDSNEVFEMKAKRRIWSIPERWKYTDAARIVRPLMQDEAFELIKILERENADNPNPRSVEPANLSNYMPIELILNPDVVTNEKIVEGWVVGNIGRHRHLDHALGPLTSFGNNMPAGYLRFMDIFGYHELSSGVRKYKVIEIKKESCVFPNDINQLLGYTDWVIENIASGDYKTVEGVVIAKDFYNDCINFVINFNTTGRRLRLVKFDYNPPHYSDLTITRVV